MVHPQRRIRQRPPPQASPPPATTADFGALGRNVSIVATDGNNNVDGGIHNHGRHSSSIHDTGAPASKPTDTAAAPGKQNSRQSLQIGSSSTNSNNSSSRSRLRSSRTNPLRHCHSDHRDTNNYAKNSDSSTTSPCLWGGINRQTIQAAGILLLAIGTSVWWNERGSFERSGNNHSATNSVLVGHRRGMCVARFFQATCVSHSFLYATTAKSKTPRCHASLAVHKHHRPRQRNSATAATTKTTLAAEKDSIPRLATVLEIPRNGTIWDIDALRDPWIQQEFFLPTKESHGVRQEPQSSGPWSPLPRTSAAFLAVYLARRMFAMDDVSVGYNQSHDNSDEEANADLHINPVLQKYIACLPNTLEDFSFHPLLWSEQDVEVLLGKHTSTYDHVVAVREMVRSEHEAFCLTSSAFARQISFEHYQIARLNVMTRSFGSGPLSSDENDQKEVSLNEIEFYQSAARIDLSQGCHVMVPLLDQLDHHAQPHVGFAYQFDQRAFVVTALRTIPKGVDIFDSYGKRTDSDLLAKYGFVNGDGSDYTQASLALFHHVNPDARDAATQHNQDGEHITLQWKLQMLRYLQYDDGYELCAAPPNQKVGKTNNTDSAVEETHDAAAAWSLKRYKYQHLIWTGHEPHRWVVRMPPRDATALPVARRTHGLHDRHNGKIPPPVFDRRQLHFDASSLLSTCRLIVLTYHDYNGTADEMIRANVRNNSFVLPPSRGDALEFRTLMCVARMSQTALARFGTTIDEQLDTVTKLDHARHKNSGSYLYSGEDNKNWTIAHVRLGEMQSLDVLKQTAFSGLRSFAKHMDSSEPAFSMRDEPCPFCMLQPLLDEVKVNMP